MQFKYFLKNLERKFIFYFISIKGKDSVAFLEKIFVADAKNLEAGTAAYTLLMNEQGGIVDDAILAKVIFQFLWFFFLIF